MMSVKNWEINGLSLPLDLEDLATMERYETAFQETRKEIKKAKKIQPASAGLRALFEIYLRLFAKIFGQETALQIFKDVPLHIRNYENVLFDFLEFVRRQQEETRQERAEKMRQFVPGNRQQRRKKQKHRRK